MFYICVSFWLLDHESRDLSQAETKLVVVKGQLISKCLFGVISALKVSIASFGLPGSFLGLPVGFLINDITY